MGKGQLQVRDYAMPKVDGGSGWDDWQTGIGAENFRRALKKVSAPFVPVLYKIVLEEKEIRAPKGASTRSAAGLPAQIPASRRRPRCP